MALKNANDVNGHDVANLAKLLAAAASSEQDGEESEVNEEKLREIIGDENMELLGKANGVIGTLTHATAYAGADLFKPLLKNSGDRRSLTVKTPGFSLRSTHTNGTHDGKAYDHHVALKVKTAVVGARTVTAELNVLAVANNLNS